MSDASVPRCHGLSEQAPPPVCSLLVVEDVLDVIRTRYLDTRTCSWTTLHGFILFFGWFFKQNTRGSFACCLLLYFYCFVIFRVSFSAKVYAPGPHGGCIISRKRVSLLCTYNTSDGCAINTILLLINSYKYIVLIRVGTIAHSPRYVNKQTTPTTKSLVCICLESPSSTPKYYPFLRAQLDFDVFLPARIASFFYVLRLIATYPPPKGHLVYICGAVLQY